MDEASSVVDIPSWDRTYPLVKSQRPVHSRPMSAHTEAMREWVRLFNARDPIDVARFFAPDFQLDQPGGASRQGLAGADDMTAGLLALGPNVQLTILDAIELGDMLAVRWQFSGIEPEGVAAGIAMYRFRDGLITDDWGVTVRAAWQQP
jgi:hypothetical protein